MFPDERTRQMQEMQALARSNSALRSLLCLHSLRSGRMFQKETSITGCLEADTNLSDVRAIVIENIFSSVINVCIDPSTCAPNLSGCPGECGKRGETLNLRSDKESRKAMIRLEILEAEVSNVCQPSHCLASPITNSSGDALAQRHERLIGALKLLAADLEMERQRAQLLYSRQCRADIARFLLFITGGFAIMAIFQSELPPA